MWALRLNLLMDPSFSCTFSNLDIRIKKLQTKLRNRWVICGTWIQLCVFPYWWIQVCVFPYWWIQVCVFPYWWIQVCVPVLVDTSVCVPVLVYTSVCIPVLVDTIVCVPVLVDTSVCVLVLVDTTVCVPVFAVVFHPFIRFLSFVALLRLFRISTTLSLSDNQPTCELLSRTAEFLSQTRDDMKNRKSYRTRHTFPPAEVSYVHARRCLC